MSIRVVTVTSAGCSRMEVEGGKVSEIENWICPTGFDQALLLAWFINFVTEMIPSSCAQIVCVIGGDAEYPARALVCQDLPCIEGVDLNLAARQPLRVYAFAPVLWEAGVSEVAKIAAKVRSRELGYSI